MIKLQPMENSNEEMSNLDDSSIVKMAADGDEEAFEEIFRRYQKKVYSLSLRMTGNPADSEDICQEIFIRVAQKIKTFQGKSEFSTWLYKIALNSLRDESKKKKRRRETELSRPPEEIKTPEDSHPQPHEQSESAETSMLVQQALLELSPRLSAPLILHELEGEPYEKIARALHVPVGTVKSRISRAKVELGKILKPQREQFL